jgi:hypothetical protein
VVARFSAMVAELNTFTAGTDVMVQMATDFSGENAGEWNGGPELTYWQISEMIRTPSLT